MPHSNLKGREREARGKPHGTFLLMSSLLLCCAVGGLLWQPTPVRIQHSTVARCSLPFACAAAAIDSDVAEVPTAAPERIDPENITLELLEWPRLSAMVAAQASTRRARELLAPGMPVPQSLSESELLHTEMEEAYRLEQNLAKRIDLGGFINIAPLVLHASKGGVLDGESLVGVAESLGAAANLVRTLREASGEAGDGGGDGGGGGVSVLPSYFAGIPVQAEIRRTLMEALDDSGKLRDSADPALNDLRFARREIATAARRELGRIIQLKSDALASRSASMRDDRYVLQVLTKQKHKVPGTVRDVSASGATLYIEPKAIEATNTKLRQLAKKEAAIERAVFKKLSALIGNKKVADEMVALQESVTRVDCALARARYSARLGGLPVGFRDASAAEGTFLPKLRHPLLVWPKLNEAADDGRMVPMDVQIPEGVRAVVITGPNTGGKTVMLKTLGMAALMARAGLRVLCAADESPSGLAHMPFFPAVMADIGDDQSIVQSLSTFSAHVARIRRILSDAAERGGGQESGPLVLLDEVGSGTDPTEGSALGMAVLRQLAKDAALTLATTHHGRLKSLKYQPGGVGVFENACVEFDVQSMAPTYRVLWGIPGRSNALEIAERLGLQSGVVDDARGLLEEESGGESVSMEEVLSDLQTQREEQRALNAELARTNAQSSLARADLEKRAAASKQEAAKLRASTEAELEEELREARATIADLIKKARDLQPAGAAAEGSKQAEREAQLASQELARMGRDSSAKAAAAASSAPAAGGVPRGLIMPGDRVMVERLGEQLVEVEIVKGSQLTVVYGGLRMKVKAKEVSQVVKPAPPPPPPPKQKKKPVGKGGKGSKDGTSKSAAAVRFDSNTLDIRGRYASEIDGDLGRAVDRAASVGTLFVIHGHGSGALKKRVRELLKEEPMVTRMEDAPQYEGGSGCTIAYLR